MCNLFLHSQSFLEKANAGKNIIHPHKDLSGISVFYLLCLENNISEHSIRTAAAEVQSFLQCGTHHIKTFVSKLGELEQENKLQNTEEAECLLFFYIYISLKHENNATIWLIRLFLQSI